MNAQFIIDNVEKPSNIDVSSIADECDNEQELQDRLDEAEEYYNYEIISIMELQEFMGSIHQGE